MNKPVSIIGGGLAGCEAAWQLVRRGHQVRLYEMKPHLYSPAHKSPLLAELVCSNSLGSDLPDQAAGILKRELRELRSLILEAADRTAVPAGRALAVDRNLFSRYIQDRLSQEKNLEIIRQEVTALPASPTIIVATGPLTSEALAKSIAVLTGQEYIYFYDAISPIVEGDSLNYDKIFPGARYAPDSTDYLNCPLNHKEYETFWQALTGSRQVPTHDFEDLKCFESCLPIEVLARRGFQTLTFGPMKPVGLIDPRSGARPYAVVQLRREDREGRLFNLVGFQTKMLYEEQKRVIRLIPGLEGARFARFGSMHRNTFIDSPRLLDSFLRLRQEPNIFFAGQITGVEGYLESTAMGLAAAIFAAQFRRGALPEPPPAETGIGALCKYVTSWPGKNFQPMNINLGLLPPLPPGCDRKQRGRLAAERSCAALRDWIREEGLA